MSFIRSTTARASAFARCARPTRYIRTAELQPWQRSLQRRTYASAHGSDAKKSDLPWMVGSLAGTGVGLYFILNQDLGHGEEHHDDAHAKHDDEHEDEEASEESSEEPAKSEESKDESKDESEDDPKDDSKDDSGEKKDEPKEKDQMDDKEERNKKDDAGAKTSSPDKRDGPDPRKTPKSQNETSGKQEGLSNSDTHHTSQISKHPEKSKKGEGVAETAKLKGTVSTERPGAENKEERGKAVLDKDA